MRTHRWALIAALVVSGAACGGGEVADENISGVAAALVTDVDNYITSLGLPPDPGVPSRVESNQNNTSNTTYNQVFQFCRRATVNETSIFGEPDLVTLNPNADALFAGSLVRASGLANGSLNPYTLPRAGGTITIDNIAAKDPLQAVARSRTLPAISKASVEQARDEILTSVPLDVAANLQMTTHRASSLTEAALSAGIDLKTAQFELSGQFGAEWKAQKNSFMLSYTQAYYTVSFNAAGQPHELFAPDVALEDVQFQMPPGDRPTFVSTVTYGRRLLVKVETNLESSSLQAEVDAAFKQAATSGSANLTASHRKTLRNAAVTVVVKGGSAEKANAIATASSAVGAADTEAEAQAAVNALADAIKNYINDQLTLPLGVPLSYSARAVIGGDTVRVAQTGTYATQDCFDRAARAKVDMKELFIHKDGDGFLAGKGEIFYDIFVQGMKIDEGDNIKRGDGETILLGVENQFPLVPVRQGEPVKVRYVAKSGDKVIDKTRTHTLNVDAAGNVSFTPSGSQAVVGETDNFKVELRYSFTKDGVLPQ